MSSATPIAMSPPTAARRSSFRWRLTSSSQASRPTIAALATSTAATNTPAKTMVCWVGVQNAAGGPLTEKSSPMHPTEPKPQALGSAECARFPIGWCRRNGHVGRRRVLPGNRHGGGTRRPPGSAPVAPPHRARRRDRDRGRDHRGPRAARPRRPRLLHRLLLEPRPRHVVLLRGLRDRLRANSRHAPSASRARLAFLARAGLRARRPARAE